MKNIKNPIPEWVSQPSGRFCSELEAMKIRFPDFALVQADDGTVGWTGFLTSNQGNQYEVLIEYRDGFPNVIPRAYVLHPKLCSQYQHIEQFLLLDSIKKNDTSPARSKSLGLIFDWRPSMNAATMCMATAVWIFEYEWHYKYCQSKTDGIPCFGMSCPGWPRLGCDTFVGEKNDLMFPVCSLLAQGKFPEVLKDGTLSNANCSSCVN